MAIDLEQFHQVFFEESIEGLEIMESSLMELDIDAIDSETINAIFRSAHSIKGGSATFGFTAIAEFTHVLETLLDQVRSDERGLSGDDVNLLLNSVDCMRDMLGLLQNGEPGSTTTPQSEELKAKFQQLLDGEAPVSTSTSVVEENTTSNSSAWKVTFIPNAELFLSGNDPLRNVSALVSMGATRVECDTENLPSFADYNVETSYLSWVAYLDAGKSEQDIREVFEWIDDICDLTIERVKTDLQHDNPDVVTDGTALSQTQNVSEWVIQFEPNTDVLRTGNDPMRIFNALSALGDMNVEANVENLPELHSLNSENCFISWKITLHSESATEEAIRELFEWVVDDSKITIDQVTGLTTAPVNTSDEKASVHPSQEIEPETQKDITVKKDAKTTPKKPLKAVAKKASAESSSIRVGIDKIDSLINMVGELVITQSMLGQLGSQFDESKLPKLMEGLGQLEQNTRELQESVMKIRMLPISFAFNRFPRMVRDLGQTLGKSVELEMRGENTELDKTVMEKIGDPLVHLVRNSVDHGLELPDDRVAKGKDPTGKVILNAFHQSGNVVIEIIDDGKGLDRDTILRKGIEKNIVSEKDAEYFSDEQVFDLIFQPGFSTAATVSDVSGRGVGMDVVKRNIQALNGVVEIKSKKDIGSTITIRLPLTLAILDGQLVRVGDHTYIFPLVSIIESLQCDKDLVNRVAGGCDVFKLRDDYVPIIELHRSFSIVPDSSNVEDSLLVVVEAEGEKVGIVVDELLGQQQVVIKSLEQNYRRVDGISGATILGDGTVALILDISGIIKLSSEYTGLNTQTIANVIDEFEHGNREKPELKLVAR